MEKYSILFDGINELKDTFYFSLNHNNEKKILLKVYNTYLNHIEYQTELILKPNKNYKTHIKSNHKNRYVEFIDIETDNIVGFFGLEGFSNLQNEDFNGYIHKISTIVPKEDMISIDAVFNEIVCHKTYMNDFINVENNDIIVDIGFNYGLFSILSLHRNPEKILAFEPNLKNVEFFKKNMKIPKINLHNNAVSNIDSTIKFYCTQPSVHSTTKEHISKFYEHKTYEVNCLDINTIIKNFNLNKIDYLKVDCEGAEFDIFDSITYDYLNNNIKKIAIEYHDSFESDNVQNLIKKLNYCNFKVIEKKTGGHNIGMIYAKKI